MNGRFFGIKKGSADETMGSICAAVALFLLYSETVPKLLHSMKKKKSNKKNFVLITSARCQVNLKKKKKMYEVFVGLRRTRKQQWLP